MVEVEAPQVERIRVDGDVERVAEILKGAKGPVVFEEADTEAFRRVHSKWTDEYLCEALGDNPFTVRYYRGGEFRLDGMWAEQIAELSMRELLERFETQEVAEYYGVLHKKVDDFAKPLFDDLARLRDEIATFAGSPGDPPHAIWIGGPNNVTPLHYDPVFRLHCVLRGTKDFTLYPADLRHLRALEAGSFVSRRRRHSRYGTGPLVAERFPKLRNSRPVHTRLGPGDVLYIPLCWWHLVSIPEELTISFTVRWFPQDFQPLWALWRCKIGTRFFAADND